MFWALDNRGKFSVVKYYIITILVLSGMKREVEELDEYMLERLIRELKKKRGRGTELVSLYIPANRQIGEVMSVLREEYSQASNIKDRVTRHHVLDALTVIMQRLKLFRRPPPNGLVVFCGYVMGEKLGDEKLEVHLIEPPRPLRNYLYRCDSVFHTEILEKMIASGETYGLIAMDREEAGFAVLQGNNLDILEVITSGVPGKHRAGGQSARRFERIIEIMTREFYKRVGERAKKYFMENHNVDGIILGGPGPSKYDFLDGDFMPETLKKKVIAVVDLGYTGEEGIYELINRSKEYLRDVKLIKEKEALEKFMRVMGKNPRMVAIGVKEVLEAMKSRNIAVLLISSDLELYKVRYRCENCGYEGEELVDAAKLYDFKINLKCPKCGSPTITFLDEEDVTDDIIAMAKEVGADVKFISRKFGEGEAFRTSFSGIAAIRKYVVK